MALPLERCYNKGCGQEYDPAGNNDDSCRFHPGGPIFHDALKGWSCCEKRSTDFTEFLSIPGCTQGPHSNEKPPEPEKNVKKNDVKDEDKEVQVGKICRPAPEVKDRPSIDENMVALKVSVAASLQQALDKAMQNMAIDDSGKTPEEESSVVKKGTVCQNNACGKTYEDDNSNSEICLHHPGVPIFHEGMKYWLCCKRKTTEFDNFMAQEGCTQGQHVWVKKKEEQKVACRFDWHQTAGFVTISVYSKLSVPDSTWIQVNRIAANIHITFDGGKSTFDKQVVLRGVIDPSKSNVKMMGTKVEINLKKSEPGSWASLDYVQAS